MHLSIEPCLLLGSKGTSRSLHKSLKTSILGRSCLEMFLVSFELVMGEGTRCLL